MPFSYFFAGGCGWSFFGFDLNGRHQLHSNPFLAFAFSEIAMV